MFAAVVLVVAATATPVLATATPVVATDSPSPEPASPAAAGYGFPTVAQDPTAPITVWVDADRSAIAAAFETDHPECPLIVQTYDASAGGSDSFHTKISLLDQAGSGWPDVAWSGQVNDASWAAASSRTAFRLSPRRSTRASSPRRGSTATRRAR